MFLKSHLNLKYILCFIIFKLISLSSYAAIYGADNRQDVLLAPPAVRPLFKSVAITVPLNFLSQNSDRTYNLDGVEKLSAGGICSNERFVTQNSINYSCTGFLISDRLLITAGHCLLPNGIIDNDNDPAFCKGFGWYFGYNTDLVGKSRLSQIPEEQIYRCTRVIRAENLDKTSNAGFLPGNDFAILELDRPVIASIPRLKINSSPLKVGQNIFTIGHPSGLPSKFSGLGPITRFEDVYYGALLDTLSGNSGGPVFNTQNEIVGILVGGHSVDYVDTKANCKKTNLCTADGKQCTENSNFTFLPTWSLIQYINPVVDYLKN